MKRPQLRKRPSNFLDPRSHIASPIVRNQIKHGGFSRRRLEESSWAFREFCRTTVEAWSADRAAEEVESDRCETVMLWAAEDRRSLGSAVAAMRRHQPAGLSYCRYLVFCFGIATLATALALPSSSCSMNQIGKILSQTCRKHHTLSGHGPSESLKKRVAEMEKRRKQRNPRKNQLFIEVPESRSFLDTATMPMILTVVGTAIFAKILMMVDESRSQEMIERKIKNAPPGQGTVRMLSREEWEEIREIRPRTPFESKLARPNARIRTGEHLRWEDVKNWTTDVFADGFTRVEDTTRHGSN